MPPVPRNPKNKIKSYTVTNKAYYVVDHTKPLVGAIVGALTDHFVLENKNIGKNLLFGTCVGGGIVSGQFLSDYIDKNGESSDLTHLGLEIGCSMLLTGVVSIFLVPLIDETQIFGRAEIYRESNRRSGTLTAYARGGGGLTDVQQAVMEAQNVLRQAFNAERDTLGVGRLLGGVIDKWFKAVLTAASLNLTSQGVINMMDGSLQAL